jgi:diguanylate cyclase (GGDEF)-like protein/putative nucleotidyltransferase with HDIG domain
VSSAVVRSPRAHAREETRLPPHVDAPLSADALVAAGQEASLRGLHDEARDHFERALHLLQRDGSQAVLASSLLRWIARAHQLAGDVDAALDCVAAALAVAVVLGDHAGIGHALNHEGILRCQQGRLDDAERLYVLARGRAARGGDVKLKAMIAQNLGVLANIRGELDTALEHYETSLAICRELGLARDIAGALNNLGMLHTDLRRWAEAEAAYHEGVEVSVALGDIAAQVVLHVNLAEMWVARGELARALTACDHAMRLAQSCGDSSSLGEAEKIFGIIARESGDHVSAEHHFARADAVATDRQDLLLSAETAREQADLHRRQGRNRDTLHCLNRAHRLFARLRATRDLADIDRRTGRLEGDFVQVARRWGESIEAKDRYTQGHCVRVADLACAIAARVGLDGKALFWFRIGALLHDVGKLMVPEDVLNKAGKLVEAEWLLMQRHTTAGVEMLAGIEFPWDVRPIVESHHERWDGRGYPHGLAGEQIPLTARILCVADVYDALTSERSYKRALTHDEAMELMRRDVGRAFDPDVFAHFEEVARQWPGRVVPGPDGDGSPYVDLSTWGGAEFGVRVRHVSADGCADEDELTRLPTRRMFLTEAAKALYDSIRQDRPLTLLLVNLDGFRRINETHGQAQGDDVLRRTADLLRHNTRGGDFVARYSGDEFVVLLPNTPHTDVCIVFDRLMRAADEARIPLLRTPDESLRVSLSIGSATVPHQGKTVEALFAAADAALNQRRRRSRAVEQDAPATAGLDVPRDRPGA